MTRRSRPGTAGPSAYRGRLPANPDVHWAFTGRNPRDGSGNLSFVVGGEDGPDAAAVAAARAAALALVGATPDEAVFMAQVHGERVATVGAADRGRGSRDDGDAVAGVDALVTREPDVALVVLVADCVPVLLAEPACGLAAVHAGRRGVQAGVVGAAVAALTGRPAAVTALVGPAIGGCCYEVPADLASTVAEREPAARTTTRGGRPGLDLPAAVCDQLRRAGVTRVERVGACTRCDGPGWFSHRAATAGERPHGRQAGLVVRRSAGAAAERLSARLLLQSPG